MAEFNAKDYFLFNNTAKAIITEKVFLEQKVVNLKSDKSKLCNNEVFMGPIAENIHEVMEKSLGIMNNNIITLNLLVDFLQTSKEQYKNVDDEASKGIGSV